MTEIPTTYYRISIKALILSEDRKKFLVCLENNDYWELPGGGLDWPESPEDCIKRELAEEMGLVVTEISSTPSYFVCGMNSKGNQSANIIYEVKVRDLNFTKSNECLEIKFISPDEIDTVNAFRNVKELAQQFK